MFWTSNRPRSSDHTPPPSTLDNLSDLVEALAHLWYQNPIVLGDLNANIQAHNPRSQQVAEMLMEFGLVYFRHHIGSAGCSNIGNVVSEAGRQIIGRKVGRRKHGGNKEGEEVYGALRPTY